MHKLLALTAVALWFSGLAAAEPPRPAVIGHRGLIQSAPECTLAAFRACLALRVGFEFDVRATKDGQLVCLHDETLERTTSGQGRLAERTLAEVRRLDASTWFDPAFAGERVPQLGEILDLLANSPPSGGLAAVDLKVAGNGIEEAVVRAAAERKVLDRLVFIGLTIESPEVRSRLKAANPDAKTARLAADESALAGALADARTDWVYVRFLPSAASANAVHAAGKRLFIAGPLVVGAEAENWKRAAELGFDAILTDYPLELARQLRGR